MEEKIVDVDSRPPFLIARWRCLFDCRYLLSPSLKTKIIIEYLSAYRLVCPDNLDRYSWVYIIGYRTV
jgi:hypothetical protein